MAPPGEYTQRLGGAEPATYRLPQQGPAHFLLSSAFPQYRRGAMQDMGPSSRSSDIASFQAQAGDALLQALPLTIDPGLQSRLGLQPVTGAAQTTGLVQQ